MRPVGEKEVSRAEGQPERTLDLELGLTLDVKRSRAQVGRSDHKVERVFVVLVKRERLAVRVKALRQAVDPVDQVPRSQNL